MGMSLCWATADTLLTHCKKVGYGTGFLKRRGPAPAGVKGFVLLFLFLFKRVKLLTQPNSPGLQPLFLVKNLSNSKRVFIKRTNGHDGQRAPLDHHHHQLHFTLNSLFVPTQNSLFGSNRTEWQFWTEPIITPKCCWLQAFINWVQTSRLSVCLSVSVDDCHSSRFRVLMPIPHGRSESLWSQRLPQKEMDRKCWNHPLS